MKKVINILICIIFAAFIALVCCGKYIFPADNIMYDIFAEEISELVSVRLLKTAFIIAVGHLIAQVATLAVWAGQKVKDNTVKTMFLLVGNVLKYVAYIAVVLVTLSAWGVDTSALVTGAGVLTLVVGLGCQTLVSDVVSGIFMLFEGDIKVGDVVVISGWRGTVIDIGLRRTKIEDTVGNIQIINNSNISTIINNTQKISYAIIDVGIEYNESIERVEAILKENFPEIKKQIPAIKTGPFYKGVSELGASSVNIKITAGVNEQDKYQTERDLNRAIKLLFDKYNVNIPFNQVVVNYRDPNEGQATVTKSTKEEAEKFVKQQKKVSKGIVEEN